MCLDMKLEICIDSIESAINAQLAGADRVELCDNLAEGGTTPGYGMIVMARRSLSIGLHVIIRPRGGDFLYSDIEYDIMRKDIELCGETGVDGVVIGILTPEGRIDIDRTARLVEYARPMKVTFHRAFDMCRDPFEGLSDIILTCADRLLTSGQKNSVPEGAQLIRELIETAGDRLIIMPGGCINEANILSVIETTGAKEYHMTGRKTIDSKMIFRRNDVFMGGLPEIPEFSRKVADTEMIKRVISILKLHRPSLK